MLLCHRCDVLCEELQLLLQAHMSAMLWHPYPCEISGAVSKGQDKKQEAKKGGGFIFYYIKSLCSEAFWF